MTILLNGKEVFLKWRHQNNTNKPEVVVGKHTYKEQSYTECWIEEADRTKIGEVAVASMHYTDKNFNKEIGRKVSLTKLMLENPAFSNKEDRKVIWNQYFNRCKNPGTKVANAVGKSELSTSTV